MNTGRRRPRRAEGDTGTEVMVESRRPRRVAVGTVRHGRVLVTGGRAMKGWDRTMKDPTEGTVRVAGTDIFYLAIRGGTPVLVVHGGPDSATGTCVLGWTGWPRTSG